MRQRTRAGLEAAAVLVTAGAGVGIAAFNRDSFSVTEQVSLGIVAAMAVLIAALVYRGRRNAYQAARTAADQQEHLTAVVEGTGVGLWESHVFERCLYVSDRWSQMIGLVRDCNQPLPNDAWRALVHPDDLALVDGVISDCIRNRDHVFQLDFRVRHAQGHWV
ncbi:MAG: PAS domain-containing protein [Steroidobacteraceae bacterium]